MSISYIFTVNRRQTYVCGNDKPDLMWTLKDLTVKKENAPAQLFATALSIVPYLMQSSWAAFARC